MDRNPPLEVKKRLRQEVRFACPIPGCTNPVLTWHHFDPPWHIKQHHDPEGMIALCTSHHSLADGGNWAKSQLRIFKKNPPSVESIRKNFLWSDASILYRLGGNYAANCPYILTISGIPIIWHTSSSDGRILFSLDFRNQQNFRVLHIEENSLTAEYKRIDDLSINTYENHLKVWVGEHNIGLELRLRHLSLDELETQLYQDASQALKKVKRCLPENLNFKVLKPDISLILDYTEKECQNSDKKVAILDFINATLYGHGKCVKIRNGLIAGSEFHFSFSHSNGGAAFAL